MSQSSSKSNAAELPPGEAVRLEALVHHNPGSIVSRTIAKNKAGTITLFAFDEGQSLSEHTAPYDAYVQVLEGVTELKIGGKSVVANAGETVLMPANIPHAVHAVQPFKMMLVMLRAEKE